VTEAKIDNMDNAKFQEFVAESKENCPVSGALKSVPMEVEAKLV
jgi:organic hydroperoxide reductase OsmC/OhrA